MKKTKKIARFLDPVFEAWLDAKLTPIDLALEPLKLPPLDFSAFDALSVDIGANLEKWAAQDNEQPWLEDSLELALLEPELDQLLDGGWADLDLPGFDLEDFQALDFELPGTELSTDVHSSELDANKKRG